MLFILKITEGKIKWSGTLESVKKGETKIMYR